MVDVGVSVGIIPDISGERVIKASLDNISKESAKADQAAAKLAQTHLRLVASNNNVQAAVTRSTAAQIAANNALESAQIKAARLAEQQKKLNDETAAGADIIGRLKTAVAGYIGLNLVTYIKDQAMQAEALRYRMEAALGVFGNAQRELGFVRDLSQKLGLSFKDTAGSFASFSASALRAGLSVKTVEEIFTGTSEAIRALKLSQDQANSVFLALEQMAGKGTVQMQELKLQLGAALPGAIEIFARAMNKTPAQFYKLVSAGAITIESLKTMGKAFHDEFGDAAVNASNSAVAAQNRLKNAVFETIDQFSQSSGALGIYSTAVNALANNFNLLVKAVILVSEVLIARYAVALTTIIARQAEAAAATIALNLAIGRLAFGSTAAAGAMGILSAAGAGLLAALPIAAIALATAGLYELAQGNKDAATATEQYAARMSKFTDYQYEFIDASAKRREQIKADVASNIEAYIAEQKALALLSQQYAGYSNLHLGAVELLGRARNNIFAPLGVVDYDPNTPGALAAKLTGNQKNIDDLEKLLKSFNSNKFNIAKPGPGVDKDAEKQAKKDQTELKNAIAGSRTEMEKLNDEIDHLEKLKGVAKTTKDIELLNRGIQNTQAEIEKLRIKAEVDSPLVKTFKDVADEIQDGFKDAFKSAFDGGGSAFEDFIKGIKKSFKSLLLDLAYQAAVKPIIVSVLASAGGSLGISNGALNSVLGAGSVSGKSSATNTNGFGSLLSTGSNFLSNGSLFSGSLANVGQGIGNVLSGVPYGAVYGPQLPGIAGVSSLGTTLGSAFGNLGYGAIGSIGANLFGLGSKNSTVNLASGTLGSLGGALIGGPIGAVAGGFIGTALGGLFGGAKPSDKAQWGSLDLSNLSLTGIGGQTGKKFSQENSDYRDKLLAEASSLATLLKSVGGVSTGSVGVHVGNRDGLRLLNDDGSVLKNYKNDASAFVTALMQQVVSHTTGLGSTYQTILGKIGTSDTQKLSDSFAFGKSYEDTLKSTDSAAKMADAIKALNDNMTSLIKTATDLNLPLEKYTGILQKQKDAAILEIKAQDAGFSSYADLTTYFNDLIKGNSSSTDQMADAIKILDDNMSKLLKTAQDFGLPLDQVTAALQKQKQAAVDALQAQTAGFNSLTDMTKAFDDFFNGQALSDTSSLTPQQKLDAAQSNFGGLLKKAQGGDLSITQDLLASAQTLINQGRDVYSSSVDYSNLEGFVRSSVQGVATKAGYNGQDVSYSIITTNQQLVQTGQNTNTSIDAMKAEIFRLSNLLASYVGKVA